MCHSMYFTHRRNTLQLTSATGKISNKNLAEVEICEFAEWRAKCNR